MLTFRISTRWTSRCRRCTMLTGRTSTLLTSRTSMLFKVAGFAGKEVPDADVQNLNAAGFEVPEVHDGDA